MTDAEKLEMLNTLLGNDPTGEENPAETRLLSAYLDLAKREIINWIYHLQSAVPDDVTDVPERFEVIQVMAVVAGYNLNGAEAQTTHHENGIVRHFRYADMVQYIHMNVPANIGFGRT